MFTNAYYIEESLYLKKTAKIKINRFFLFFEEEKPNIPVFLFCAYLVMGSIMHIR